MAKRSELALFFLVLILMAAAAIASSGDIIFTGNNINYPASEDALYSHNLSANITGTGANITFSIYEDSTNTVKWNYTTINYSQISSWIFISNSTLGTLVINATKDNQTGNFIIPIKVSWINSSEGEGYTSGVSFNFNVSAVNDAPVFTSVQPEYNLTENNAFSAFVNASDEENHFPLAFNFNFTTCETALWSTRDNCTLFSAVNYSNTSSQISFTPSHNDVGKYYVNVSVMDYGESYTCSGGYCAADYSQNKTTYYSQIVIFNVFSSLRVDISLCNNSVLYENQMFNCTINITSKGQADSLTALSNSTLRNSATPSYVNRSWVYSGAGFNSSNFSASVLINATPQKREVGNWTINFSVSDLDSGESQTVQIYFYVNRTVNSLVALDEISNQTIYENKTIYVNASDDDLLVPDKIVYNENLTFASNSSWVSVTKFSTPSGGNYSMARIEINHNYALSVLGTGNYTVRVNVSDISGNYAERNFTIQVLNDSAPVWNSTMASEFIIYEDNLTYLNLTANVIDAENDAITFSYSNNTSFPSFSLNATTGVINFTSGDADVGEHILIINASDNKTVSSKTFNFTVYNVNDAPFIEGISSQAAIEDTSKDIVMHIQDEDLRIPLNQAGFYNESFGINLTIQGVNSSLFSFALVERLNTANKSRYIATFTPRKADVGSYNITINVCDAGNLSYQANFTLTISSINHAPVLMNISNQTSAINRNFYLEINATDIEDGNSSAENTNFTFSYNFLSGGSFLNSTFFNLTSGKINITFNSSQYGAYRINITVNDSNNLQDSRNFWVFVYGTPNITFPDLYQNFSLQEGNVSDITFRANHSVQNNLTYYFYLNNILRYNLSYYGNDTNLTWQFNPNFTDEGYGMNKNLSLVVYNPSYPELNATAVWGANISHTNAPINFSGYIGDKQAAYTSTISISLKDYFSDADYSDVYYNQTINFSVASNATPSYITSSVSSGWALTLSSSVAVVEVITVSGRDYNESNSSLTNSSSNSFLVEFTTPATTPSPAPSSGGGGSSIPIALKIILPEPLSAYTKDKISLPLTLRNGGKMILYNIDLSGIAAINNVLSKDISLSFSRQKFSQLSIGEEINITMDADIDTETPGLYELTITGKVESPKFSDWGKLYLTVKEGNMSSAIEKIIFTEELIAENPRCVELMERVNEARKLSDSGRAEEAIKLSQDVIDACRYAIMQVSIPIRREKLEDRIFKYIVFSTLVVFFVGLTYYTYKRRKLKRMRRVNLWNERWGGKV